MTKKSGENVEWEDDKEDKLDENRRREPPREAERG